MRATILQVVGAVCVVAGVALIAPFAAVIVTGVLLIAFGIAIERG
jgi:hypothetical protein